MDSALAINPPTGVEFRRARARKGGEPTISSGELARRRSAHVETTQRPGPHRNPFLPNQPHPPPSQKPSASPFWPVLATLVSFRAFLRLWAAVRGRCAASPAKFFPIDASRSPPHVGAAPRCRDAHGVASRLLRRPIQANRAGGAREAVGIFELKELVFAGRSPVPCLARWRVPRGWRQFRRGLGVCAVGLARRPFTFEHEPPRYPPTSNRPGDLLIVGRDQ